MFFITQNNIGKIRRFFFMPFSCKWNGWVRDITARLENKDKVSYEVEISAQEYKEIQECRKKADEHLNKRKVKV